MQTILITSAVAMIVASCGPEIVYETLDTDGTLFCQTLANCEERSEPARYLAKCKNEIVDQGQDALVEGKECSKSYASLVHCFAHISCEAYWVWGSKYANEDQLEEYPCDVETDAFLAGCDDTWFAVNAKR